MYMNMRCCVTETYVLNLSFTFIHHAYIYYTFTFQINVYLCAHNIIKGIVWLKLANELKLKGPIFHISDLDHRAGVIVQILCIITVQTLSSLTSSPP